MNTGSSLIKKRNERLLTEHVELGQPLLEADVLGHGAGGLVLPLPDDALLEGAERLQQGRGAVLGQGGGADHGAQREQHHAVLGAAHELLQVLENGCRAGGRLARRRSNGVSARL